MKTAITRVLAGGFLAGLLSTTALAQATCPLNHGSIKHIVMLQFDNVHLSRDNKNVPSDLEQMPTLMNFLRNNGVLASNDHTQLISHTAGGIVTTLTGVYPDRHGQAVSNAFGFFNPDGSVGFSSSFAYWTNKLSSTDQFIMVDENGHNAPAPWSAFTRAGCDVGMTAVANMEFENTKSDVLNVFGAGSPECAEAKCTVSTFVPKAQADFVGIAVHCARGSLTCAPAHNGKADVLPDPTYTGFNALYGHASVAPVINGGSAVMTDLLGGPIQDTSTPPNPGFPGFDGMFPEVTGAYAAKMLEAGIPVFYGYISDAHDRHVGLSVGTGAFGPGEADYVAQLKVYDLAFAAFFQELKAHGIDKSNTLFVFTADEGDHFVGGKPTRPECDGINVPCDYAGNIGEISGDVRRLLSTQTGDNTQFSVHSDMAPNVYVPGNPAATTSSVRHLEHDLEELAASDPVFVPPQTVPLFVAFADRAAMKLLHMVTGDPSRTPTVTPFAFPDFFLSATSAATPPPCLPTDTGNNRCTFQNPAFAWNHGGVDPAVARTWRGMVGPGVRNIGLDTGTWMDHTDLRPTVLMLAGLKGDYVHDGRAVVEHMADAALPLQIVHHRSQFVKLASTYKQLTAPFGKVGVAAVPIATNAVLSDSPGDAKYLAYIAMLDNFTARRDALAADIRTMLDDVSFNGAGFDPGRAEQLTDKAERLISEIAGRDQHGDSDGD
jgi:hypothetical protein